MNAAHSLTDTLTQSIGFRSMCGVMCCHLASWVNAKSIVCGVMLHNDNVLLERERGRGRERGRKAGKGERVRERKRERKRAKENLNY